MTGDPEAYRMSFGDHLEELRRRLIVALVAPAILAVPAFLLGSWILEWLFAPLRTALRDQKIDDRIQVLSPVEPFMSYFKIAVLVAVLAALPVIVWQLWRFIAPGLYPHERRFAHLLVPLSVVLLLAGLSFNYYVVLPLTLRFFVAFGQGLAVHDNPFAPPPSATTPPGLVENMPVIPSHEWDPPEMKSGAMYYNTRRSELRLKLDDGTVVGIPTVSHAAFVQQYEIKAYINFVLGMMLGFAIAFQLPLVILLLGWVGIVDVVMLRRWRRYAILACVVAGAVLTPSADVTSLFAMAVPLYLLYELSIVGLRVLPLSRLAHESNEG